MVSREFHYDQGRDGSFSKKLHGRLEKKNKKKQPTHEGSREKLLKRHENTRQSCWQDVYRGSYLQKRGSPVEIRNILRRNSFMDLRRFLLPQCGLVTPLPPPFFPDGECRYECHIQESRNPSCVQLLGCSTSCLSVSTFHAPNTTTAARHVLWKPHDPLCGTLRSHCSANGERVVAVVSTDFHNCRALILNKTKIVEHPIMTGLGPAEDIYMDNDRYLFLAGKGCGKFDMEHQHFNWNAGMEHLPNIRCLSVNTMAHVVVTGHRGGHVTLWDTRQGQQRDTARLCPKNFAIQQVLVTQKNWDLIVSHIDGHLSRYDLRCTLGKGPYQTLGDELSSFSGAHLLGQFCFNENMGILAARQTEKSLYVYNLMSVKPSCQEFSLPCVAKRWTDRWSMPFFIPSFTRYTLSQYQSGPQHVIKRSGREAYNCTLRSHIMSAVYDTNTFSTDCKIMSISHLGAVLIGPPSHNGTMELDDRTFDHW